MPEALDALESVLDKLLSEHASLQRERDALRSQVVSLEDEVSVLRSAVNDLRGREMRSVVAEQLLEGQGVGITRDYLEQLMREVDACISLLRG